MYNKMTVLGRLTATPEQKYSASGLPYTSFSLAVDRNFTDKDGNRQTDFFKFVAWRHHAQFICKNFKKGETILIEGSMQTNSYKDSNGDKRTAYEVLVEGAFFTGNKKSSASQQEDNINEASDEDDAMQPFTDEDDPGESYCGH